jgi:hypothetical protein
MKQNIQKAMIIAIVIAMILLIKNWFDEYTFKHNPIPTKLKQQLLDKEIEVKTRIYQHYNIHFNIPMIITDKVPSRLYGLTALDKGGNIKVYLNKKRMRESMEYMVEEVVAHEYAHALMFYFGDTTRQQGGHTSKWQTICQNLGGARCERYVNHDDIIMGKLPF